MSSSKPVLAYWKIRGLAQPTRFLLAYLNIDYNHKIYEYDPNNPPDFFPQNWLNDKFNLGLDFPNLPYWIDGDIKLTQSIAILRLIARQNDPSLIPDGPNIEMVQNYIMDVWFELASLIYGYTEERAVLFEIDRKSKLELLSKYLGNKNWVMGDNITYVDFLLYEVLYRQHRYKTETLSPFPNLEQLKRNFESIPTISKFIASPEYIKSPCFGAKTVLKGF